MSPLPRFIRYPISRGLVFSLGMLALAISGGASMTSADDLTAKILALPVQSTDDSRLPERDWLLSPPAASAGLFQTGRPGEIVLDNGLLSRTFLVTPNLGCVGMRQGTTGESLLRSLRPECRITLDGRDYEIGGLGGAPVQNFLKPEWYDSLQANPDSFQLVNFSTHPMVARFHWEPRTAWLANQPQWPPRGIEVRFEFRAPTDAASVQGDRDHAEVGVTVHYELYEGLPLICKWFTLHNRGSQPVRVNAFTSEILACVEASSQVEDLAEPLFPNLHVETDYTTCSMQGAAAQIDAVHWMADPTYGTQVNYRLQSKCLLECRPSIGPDVDVPPGETLSSFRTWILAFDSRDEIRQSLALNKMYRTLAPWVAENPLIHHVRSADPMAVRLAIEQCSEVGFELVIMTFGSGFNMENESAEYLQQIRELAEEAHSRGIGLGGYSLLASRSVSEQDDVINPETGKPGGFARFENSPCLESAWGQDYFRKLYQFFEKTGCDVLEHDGSYPGDSCASTEHPGHEGFADSRWRQWQSISRFYQWCRGQGVYLNVPDWYFLNGSSKTGMGYRETNWSLPRDLQEIIERQNIHDGTRYKLPTMGWMFVPLTEYHGGGPAATIEPLHEHRDHYERRLQNLLGAGVQACFRGPRLYDTEQTKAVVQRWVRFYKQHRAILDSSLIPLRRADGRDWDGWLHVNPELDTCALAMLYNPLKVPISRNIVIPLYYSGCQESAFYRVAEGERLPIALDRQERAHLSVTIPPQGAIWITFEKADDPK